MPSSDAQHPHRRFALTSQTWLAVSSALVFLVLALIISFSPVPYLVWGPGDSHDLAGSNPMIAQDIPVVNVGKLANGPINGHLLVVTVAQSRTDSLVTLPEALFAHWGAKRDVLPRSVLVPPGKSEEEIADNERTLMVDSQREATIAAMIAAKKPVTQRVQVASVSTTGPSQGKLQPGDFIVEVDGQKVVVPSDVNNILTNVKKRTPGQTINVQLLREGKRTGVDITLGALNNDKKLPTLGVRLDAGYDLANTDVTYGIPKEIGGPSAGLALALGAFDVMSPLDLIAGRTVAATGEIDDAGNVYPIGGLQEKLASAEKGGATIMLIPSSNCVDLEGASTTMRIVPVDTLQEGIDALQALRDPEKAKTVPSCP